MQQRVLVTGANGFVGRTLCAEAAVRGWEINAAIRQPYYFSSKNKDQNKNLNKINYVLVNSLDEKTDWQLALANINIVVHLAARVHVMQDVAVDPLTEFRRVNVDGTLNLARQAAAAGVSRFVFISSIKVNGEATLPGRLFKADDVPTPLDAYGISKFEAEQGLKKIAAQTGMDVVIIRPPLVYGPGVKANFAAMMRWLRYGVPLPLGSINNRRSLVALDNLVDLILVCLTHLAAANQIFLVSDGEDISTSELLCRIGRVMNRPTRLFFMPISLLKCLLTVLGKKNIAQRLFSSLQVDIKKNHDLLNWHPCITLDDGLKKLAKFEVDSI